MLNYSAIYLANFIAVFIPWVNYIQKIIYKHGMTFCQVIFNYVIPSFKKT